MKSSSLKFILIAFLLLRICDTSAQIIKTKVPKRDKGQTDVLRLATPAIPVVRIGIIGLGMRGTGAVERITHIPGVEIVALCDMIEERTKAANDTLVKHGMPKAEVFLEKMPGKK